MKLNFSFLKNPFVFFKKSFPGGLPQNRSVAQLNTNKTTQAIIIYRNTLIGGGVFVISVMFLMVYFSVKIEKKYDAHYNALTEKLLDAHPTNHILFDRDNRIYIGESRTVDIGDDKVLGFVGQYLVNYFFRYQANSFSVKSVVFKNKITSEGNLIAVTEQSLNDYSKILFGLSENSIEYDNYQKFIDTYDVVSDPVKNRDTVKNVTAGLSVNRVYDYEWEGAFIVSMTSITSDNKKNDYIYRRASGTGKRDYYGVYVKIILRMTEGKKRSRKQALPYTLNSINIIESHKITGTSVKKILGDK